MPDPRINYADPRCNCAMGGMGRRADCDVHGTPEHVAAAAARAAREAAEAQR